MVERIAKLRDGRPHALLHRTTVATGATSVAWFTVGVESLKVAREE